MFFSNEYYQILFKSNKDDLNKINILLYFKIIDELYSHNIKTRNTSLQLNALNIIFNLCEDQIIRSSYKIGLINKLFLKDYENASSTFSGNYVIINMIFKNFEKFFSNEKIKINFDLFPDVIKSYLFQFINKYVQHDFIGDIFYN